MHFVNGDRFTPWLGQDSLKLPHVKRCSTNNDLTIIAYDEVQLIARMHTQMVAYCLGNNHLPL